MNLNPNTPLKSKKKSSAKVALRTLEGWLKEFELAYNLSPELSKSQIKKLREEFQKIFTLDYNL